jgi:hypothetical protein
MPDVTPVSLAVLFGILLFALSLRLWYTRRR